MFNPRPLLQEIKRNLQHHIDNGVVEFKDTKKRFIVKVKTPTEFYNTGKYVSENGFDTSHYNQNQVKRFLKEHKFSFDGSGTHVLDKTNVYPDDCDKSDFEKIDIQCDVVLGAIVSSNIDQNGHINIEGAREMIDRHVEHLLNFRKQMYDNKI